MVDKNTHFSKNTAPRLAKWSPLIEHWDGWPQSWNIYRCSSFTRHWNSPPSLCDRYKECASSCLFNMSQSLYICPLPSSKHLSRNLSGSVRNTALQIGTQLGVKVNGSDLQKRDLQLPHLLWQPWHHNILCTKNNFLKGNEEEKKSKKSKGEQENVFLSARRGVGCISCPWIFARWFTFIGELEKLSVRLKIALRQVKMILPGLRSEEMGKEKNTRENKSQSNVNMGRTERSCLSPWR